MSATLQLEDRIEKCRKILEDNPRSQIFAALGEAYRKKGDLERAYLITKQGLEHHPDYGPAHVVMGKIYLERRLYGEAEKELETAMKLDGKTRATEKLLAEVWLRKGELEKAQEALLRLKESGPADESISTLLNLSRGLKERPPAPSPERFKERPRELSPLLQLSEQYRGYDEVRSAPAAAAKPEKIYSWGQLVDALRAFPLVRGGLIIGPDGLIVEHKSSGTLNPDLVGPLCLSVVEIVVQNLPRLDFGKLGQVLIETSSVIIWIWQVRGHYLVLWADPEVNLGSFKMRVTQVLEEIDF
jgi:predicted regulator of Ras-like GTPase activity (Roadblock/LC7/MglB family)